eukprot:CAMPEP_0170065056 /NCGR_PEP_ID=MMETSP0019_2-20121128/5292_1 /TAXON_ID=98059 /ORGANISM="Dinobryon sp., Strain UTEXLB2267" /LENGTH=828 /DNA_ID=CAMNT_0010271841 /DNA_START=1237 /DNA_END=3723 /DNA_ORIENTATION=-
MGIVFSMLLYSKHLVAAAKEILRYLFTSIVLGEPLSYPGDPIPNPQTRFGKWEDKEYKLPVGWKFACDSESQDVSIKIHSTSSSSAILTGESAGRQIWWYDEKSVNGKSTEDGCSFNANRNPNSSDQLLRRLLKESNKAQSVSAIDGGPAKKAAHKAMSFYETLQCSDGHWAGDYGGPMFLLPGLICSLYLTNAPFPPGRKEAMISYLYNHQQLDGGWGTHIECASTMFGTVLSYVSLRLLGEDPEAKQMQAARKFINTYGGALYAPSWAKFWLAVIGVYDWKGINSIPVEMWLLPRWFPIHPGKMWCHCRMVYLPMGYLYGTRFVPSNISNDEILQGLRKELYCGQKYEDIEWDSFRQTCANIDEYSPLNPIMKVAQDVLSVYENFLLPRVALFRRLREAALSFVEEYIAAEDEQTNYVCIGPVNKALNMLSVWAAHQKKQQNGTAVEPCEAFLRHLPRVDDYLWVAEDGMKMQGYNGSQCWDTSFAAQAIVEGDLAKSFPECAKKVYSYLNRTQIASDEKDRERYFRHASKGGWPFSTAAHGWPITDCTSEGLKTVISLHKVPQLIPLEQRISSERLASACDLILSYQNADGGWATYENNRGYRWYEMLNPSEVFGDIMIDYSYVECSSACITALKDFASAVPNHRAAELLQAMQAGGQFLKTIQRADGSWYGSWGNCFTYGTWFGVEGLVAAGEVLKRSEALQRAVNFLLKKQNPNGGWGESYLACVNKDYPAEGAGEFGDEGSGVVQTAWALLALQAAECHDTEAIKRGIDYLIHKQLPSGDWAQEGITGVFNRSCGITYTAYRNVFPLWALCRYASRYEITRH